MVQAFRMGKQMIGEGLESPAQKAGPYNCA